MKMRSAGTSPRKNKRLQKYTVGRRAKKRRNFVTRKLLLTSFVRDLMSIVPPVFFSRQLLLVHARISITRVGHTTTRDIIVPNDNLTNRRVGVVFSIYVIFTAPSRNRNPDLRKWFIDGVILLLYCIL